MADYLPQLGDLPSKIASSKRILMALSKDFSVDALASALSLALALQKNGKTVSVVSEGNPLVSHSHLFGIGDVKNEVPSAGEGNYIIKLDGVVDPSGQMNTVPSLEKLDWYPEGSSLNLVFHVVPGQRFEPTNVTYSHETSGFDLILAVGVTSLNELGQIYLKNAPLFSKSTVVNIDADSGNTNFGNINIVDTQASSISEMVLSLLKNLNLESDSDIASNVVAGIYNATANLTQKVSPNTFAAVSEAMQAGGKLPESGQIREEVPKVEEKPAVESVQPEVPAQLEANQIQFSQPSQPVVEAQSTPQEPAAPVQEVTPQVNPAPVQPEPVVAAEPVQAQPVTPSPSAEPAQAPANDLYSNPFLNPGGSFGAPSVPASPSPAVPAAPAPAQPVAPASGPTFNFGSFGDQSSVVSPQSSAGQASVAPQEPVAPAPVQEEKVDVSGILNTIQQANQKDDAYDLKQIFKVEQMPETPTSGNTTVDSAIQQPNQPSVVGLQSSAQTVPQVQPVQDTKAQSSPEEKPAGEAVNSVNPEAEVNPTPDWLVPKIFKGGSLG